MAVEAFELPVPTDCLTELFENPSTDTEVLGKFLMSLEGQGGEFRQVPNFVILL